MLVYQRVDLLSPIEAFRQPVCQVVHPLVPAVSGHPDVAGDSLAVNAFHDDAGNRESHHLLPPDWMNGGWGSKTPVD